MLVIEMKCDTSTIPVYYARHGAHQNVIATSRSKHAPVQTTLGADAQGGLQYLAVDWLTCFLYPGSCSSHSWHLLSQGSQLSRSAIALESAEVLLDSLHLQPFLELQVAEQRLDTLLFHIQSLNCGLDWN